MRKIAEFRVVEEFASLLFREDEGRRLGDSIRLITMDVTDPRYEEVGRLDRELRIKHGRSFYHGWGFNYIPSREELERARLFQLLVTAYFEPAGEECGTQYNEAAGCPECHSGAPQTGPLILQVSRIPKRKEIAITIAEEIVVSRRLAELLASHGVTGVALGPVLKAGKSRTASPDWLQLFVPGADAEIIAPTRVGVDLFNDDSAGENRCPRGDLIGLNRLSDVTIRESTRGEADFIASRQFIGVRRGLLRPRRLIFVSPRVRELFIAEKIKGCEFVIATLASEPGARQSWNV